jgi:hypothetical protein
MSEVAIGRFVLDLLKFFRKELSSWSQARKDDASQVITFVASIADKLDAYVDALRSKDFGTDAGRLRASKQRHELDSILENLGYTFKGKVDHKILGQMLVALTRGKATDGILIPALGEPLEKDQALSGPAREAAIQNLLRASAAFRTAADTLAVRKSVPLPRQGKVVARKNPARKKKAPKATPSPP